MYSILVKRIPANRWIKMEEMEFKITGLPGHSVSEKAGVKKGDILLSIDDVEIKNIADLKVYLHYKNKGDMVKLKVFRPIEEEAKEEDKDKDKEVKGEEILIDVTL